MQEDSKQAPLKLLAVDPGQQRPAATRDLKGRLEKLLSQATDCELIGNLATDKSKRARFRRTAGQFRLIAENLKNEIDRHENSDPTSDEQFLFQQAKKCRALQLGYRTKT